MTTVWVVAPEDPGLATYFAAFDLAEGIDVDIQEKPLESLMDAFQHGGWPNALLADWDSLAYIAREFPIADLPNLVDRLAVYVPEPSTPVDPDLVDRPHVRVIHATAMGEEAERAFTWLTGTAA